MNSHFFDPLPHGWRQRITGELGKAYFSELKLFLKGEIDSKTLVYPQPENILRALQDVDFENVKVVILGQDPYHGSGQALGRSFAVPNGHFPKPPSLKNIFKEIESDLGQKIEPQYSDLSGWAKQGVLLLNSVLTVRADEPFSHREKGWEQFTDHLICELSKREKPIVFILWGAAARNKKDLIDLERHFVVESAHPSPLSASRGFLGSKPFSKTNQILVKKLGLSPIQWEKTV
jgi:uracil-DNA glycosylase